MTDPVHRARRSRREAARRQQTGTGRSPLMLLAVIGTIVGAGVIAILLSNGAGGSSPAITPRPVGTAGPGASASAISAPVITGSPLPTFTATDADPAKGMAAPVVMGSSFDGSPVSIQPTGKPTVVVFIAHWCPHCQREVPLLQAWINQGGAPEGIDFVSVATAIDPTRPNYPPQDWLEREGWSLPVIVDPTDSMATAYGLASYPFWVFLDGDGKVVLRTAGELKMGDLTAILTGLKAR